MTIGFIEAGPRAVNLAAQMLQMPDEVVIGAISSQLDAFRARTGELVRNLGLQDEPFTPKLAELASLPLCP
jgi:hypothetical protein